MDATVVFGKNWDAIHDENTKYIVNLGSSRSSKTHSLIQTFYCYAYENPNTKLSVFRDTKKICKDTVFEDMKKIYPSMHGYEKVVMNLTESFFKFPNGSIIRIEGTDDSVKIHGYHSDVLWFNESYNISKDTFDQLDMRCSGKVFLDLNPRQDHWSEDLKKDERTILIHSTFKDNPFCPAEQKSKILSYQPIKSCSLVESKQIKENDARHYDLVSNSLNFTKKEINELIRCRQNESKGSADEFKWQVYGLGLKAERPNRIFRWGEISLDSYLSLDILPIYGNDWGVVDPWAIVECKYKDGNLYVRELNYKSENILRNEISNTDRIQIESDKSSDVAIEGGIVIWMFSKLGIDKNRDIICDTNRPLKITALRNRGYRALTANKPKGSIIDGIDTLCELNVFFTSDSHNLKHEQENYSRKVDNYGVVLEEPEDANNHLIDAVRYCVLQLKRLGVIKSV